jgi:hypothetical protein
MQLAEVDAFALICRLSAVGCRFGEHAQSPDRQGVSR